MKRFVLCILAAGLCSFGTAVYSQTPDGQTPAQEAVCDPLKADGVSKGLYGLCVAFCEAHDADDLVVEADPETGVVFSDTARPSSLKLYANYERKRDLDNTADIPMPCVQFTSPCPCFASEDVNRILDLPGAICETYTNRRSALVTHAITDDGPNSARIGANTGPRTPTVCYHYEPHEAAPRTAIAIEITPEEYSSCKAIILAECDAAGY
jgi:hypothetical protein